MEPLSDRQISILKLLAGDRTERVVADRLNLSINTIKYYKKQLYSRLEVKSLTGATVRALKLGIISIDDIELEQTTKTTQKCSGN